MIWLFILVALIWALGTFVFATYYGEERDERESNNDK